jgi:hypothetical protein
MFAMLQQQALMLTVLKYAGLLLPCLKSTKQSKQVPLRFVFSKKKK